MRRKFVRPTIASKVNIAKSYRTYLAKLMSAGTYYKFNFFADILSGMQVQEDPNTSTFSIGVVEGHYLMKYSPTMVEQLDEFGAGIVICHELGHPSLSHHSRMLRLYSLFESDPVKQCKAAAVIHIAADYALNSWLIDDCGIFTLKDLKCRVGKPVESGDTFQGTPMGSYAGIHPSDVGLPSSKSMEWYIDVLSKRITNNPDWSVSDIVSPSGNDSGDSSEGQDSPGDSGDSESSSASAGGSTGSLNKAASQMTDEQYEALLKASGIDPSGDIANLSNPAEGSSTSELADQLKRDFTRIMAQSRETIKSRGTLPGAIEELVENLLRPPEVDWRQELRNYCATARPSRKKTTLSRPKRKHVSITGAITSDHPGKRKNPSYQIVFAIDTSASVSNSELQEIFTELRGILALKEGTEITVVECDTHIGRIYDLGSVKDIDTKVTGRGGTSFDPVFRWIAGTPFEGTKCAKQPDLLIYATDGECSLPPVEVRLPQSKVLWLISSRGKVPCEGYGWGRRPTKVKGFADYGRYILVGK